MSLTGDKLDAMIAAGLTREQMAVLLKAEIAADEKAKAERRARAAAKKRRQRAEVALEPFDVPGTLGDNEGHGGTSGDDEGQAGTGGDETTARAKEGPTTQENTTKQKQPPSDPKGSSPPEGADRRRGHRIPDGFEHSPEARQIAADFGFHGADAAEALAEFADYWRPLPGLKGTKLDWSGTLRNRLREVARRRGSRASPGAGQRRSNAADERAAILQLVKNGGSLGPSDASPAELAATRIIEHQDDGRSDRDLFRSPGGDSGQFPEDGVLRLARPYGR